MPSRCKAGGGVELGSLTYTANQCTIANPREVSLVVGSPCTARLFTCWKGVIVTSGHSQRIKNALDRLSDARRSSSIGDSTEQNVRRWLTDSAYEPYKEELLEHIEGGKFRDLEDSFWTILSFGTGGLRGRMYPIGPNAINDRTIGESAQGLAYYLTQQHGGTSDVKCVIAHDTRNRSEAFARLAASVLAGNGIRVFLFRSHRATPQLSFTVIRLHASAGIVISASHNPPTDNGFKCFGPTGGQLLPEEDRRISEFVKSVQEVRSKPFEQAVHEGLITYLGPGEDDAYVDAVVGRSLGKERNLRIVYSPLHGVGMTNVARVLKRAGFEDLHIVDSQATPDGSFPNVAGQIPNPEQPAVLGESIELARRLSAELVLASDPDGDRIGAAAPDSQTGQWLPLTGNQIGALLTDYVLGQLKKDKKLRRESYVVKTLVTTPLVKRIAEAYGVRVIWDLPVGFKWIGETISKDQEKAAGFVFGAEESHGYLCGTYARDKDGALGALLLAELAAELKVSGTGLWGHLDELYRQHGYQIERTVSKIMPGKHGALRIREIMNAVRTRPPDELAGIPLVRLYDYARLEVRSLRDSSPPRYFQSKQTEQVRWELDRPGWELIARPSGTEPKIKFYLFGYVPSEQLSSEAALEQAKRSAGETIGRICNELEQFVRKIVG